MIIDTDKLKFKRNISPELREKKRLICLANLSKARKAGKLGRTGKHATTLLKENIEKELRDNFIAAVMPHLPDITYEMLFQAINGDGKMLQYITNQLIGKAKETVEQTGSPEGLREIEVSMRELLSRKEEQA